MGWIVILLICIIIILLISIFRFRRDIKYISRQIINSKGQYRNILMDTLDKDIENLVISINGFYEHSQKRYVKIKHNEEELRKSIANLSHDLRTPLTSIMGYIQIISSDRCTEEEKMKYLDIVDRRTETLQSLITSFYELSVVESSEYNFKLRSVNLGNLLYETVALYYDDFTNRNIEPKINVNQNISLVISDEKAVIRIFSNLIINMIRHGDGNVVINLIEQKDYIITEFINSTSGLSDQDVKHIFDRFFTADKARSEKNTGLGLSITRALVESLGNKIAVNFADETLNVKVIWHKK